MFANYKKPIVVIPIVIVPVEVQITLVIAVPEVSNVAITVRVNP